jgi:hypothetical protein
MIQNIFCDHQKDRNLMYNILFKNEVAKCSLNANTCVQLEVQLQLMIGETIG